MAGRLGHNRGTSFHSIHKTPAAALIRNIEQKSQQVLQSPPQVDVIGQGNWIMVALRFSCNFESYIYITEKTFQSIG